MGLESHSATSYLKLIDETALEIAPDRKQFLSDSARTIQAVQAEFGFVNLLFVCTHNSRRSQFAEFWAGVISLWHDCGDVRVSSCGTEVTACHPNTIAALQRAGARVENEAELSVDSHGNPHYQIAFAGHQTKLFSKAFGHESLPSSNIVAMMCCDDADQKCPHVPGANARVPLHFQDPKISDGTDRQDATYDARCLQIAAEIRFLMSEA